MSHFPKNSFFSNLEYSCATREKGMRRYNLPSRNQDLSKNHINHREKVVCWFGWRTQESHTDREGSNTPPYSLKMCREENEQIIYLASV